MASLRQLARDLCATLLAGAWLAPAMVARGQRLFGEQPPWLDQLVDDLVTEFGPEQAPPAQRLHRFVRTHSGFIGACRAPSRGLSIARYELGSARCEQPPAYLTAPIPPLACHRDVADWLDLSSGELDWLADSEGRQARIPPGPLRHYRYRWIAKRRGGQRLLEIPKPRLKAIQQTILHQILDAVPAHPAAHGFRRGHDCLSYATPHVGQPLLLKLDLQDFFPAIAAARIHGLFRALGYPWRVARLLTGLCTNRVAHDGLSATISWQQRQQLHFAHLPQGAPSSPALANLAAFALDQRLSGLAGQRQLRYSRYADDLALSGAALGPNQVAALLAQVGAIALEEGFVLNPRKTRVMRASQAQRLTGISVNTGINVPRADYDRLKATLHNCVRLGPASQNRHQHADYRAHLQGRVAHVGRLNPNRGRRLQTLFERIAW